MLKFKRFSMFSLVSAVLLFMMILPALAMEGEGSSTCTVSSDGVETCVSDSIGTGENEGSEPGNPGEESVDPAPVDPVEEVPVEEKPSEEVPVVEEKPVEEAPDVVVDEEGSVVPEDWIKRTDSDEEAIEDDGIRYFITADLASNGSQFAANANGIVAGVGMIASMAGLTLLAFRNKKK